jgi:hypothetical protein
MIDPAAVAATARERASLAALLSAATAVAGDGSAA